MTEEDDMTDIFEDARHKYLHAGKLHGRALERVRTIETLRQIVRSHDPESTAATALGALEAEHERDPGSGNGDSATVERLLATMRGGAGARTKPTRDPGDIVADIVCGKVAR